LDSASVIGNTFLTEFGGGNEIQIDNQAPGSVFTGQVAIDIRGSNNLLSINSQHRTPEIGSTSFEGGVTAKLGRGANTLLLALIGDVEFGSPSRFDGGAGHNTALVGSVSGIQPTVVRFQ